VFGKEYMKQPIVNVTITLEGSEGEEDVFANDVRYVVTRKSIKGFTILLNKNVISDTTFSWTAFAVKDPTVSFSLVSEAEDIVEPSQILQLTIEPEVVDIPTDTDIDTPSSESLPTTSIPIETPEQEVVEDPIENIESVVEPEAPTESASESEPSTESQSEPEAEAVQELTSEF
jgi:hypothetical protein